MAANVSVVEFGDTPCSSRYAGISRPPTKPRPYWPRTATRSTSSGVQGRMDRSTLAFSKDGADLAVERSRRRQIASERLFDDRPHPARILPRHAGTAQIANDVHIIARSSSEVEDAVASRAPAGIVCGEDLLEPGVH